MVHNKLQFHNLSFDTKWITQVIGLLTASLACLAAALVYSHPIPKDTALKITSLEDLLRDNRENAFAVMDMDVSATELTVHDNGQEHTIYVSSGTVADALETVGITLGEFDELSVDHDAQIHNGMDIYITRVSVVEDYRYEDIPYETVVQSSSSLLKGSEVVIQKGENGIRQYTYDMIYKNGVMTDRVLAGTSVYEKPRARFSRAFSTRRSTTSLPLFRDSEISGYRFFQSYKVEAAIPILWAICSSVSPSLAHPSRRTSPSGVSQYSYFPFATLPPPLLFNGHIAQRKKAHSLNLIKRRLLIYDRLCPINLFDIHNAQRVYNR